MSAAAVVQSNYDQLSAISQRFNRQVEVCAGVRQRVQQALAPLQQGGWEGRGAAAFFSEMDQEILPTIQRLEHALNEGRLVVDEIVAIFQAAEAEASQLFGGDMGGGAQPSSGSTPSAIEGSQGIASTPAEPNVTPPSTLFSNKYMSDMVGRTWPGEDNRLMSSAMHTLRQKNPSPADEKRALDIIAAQRGLDRATVQAQYERYRELRNKAEAKGKTLGDDLPPFGVFPDYMGSRSHLRFGQIVGEALGLDAVFGALLNPTGGMPGPGALAFPANDSALAHHSAFHDSAGFLKTHFDIGPGYDYLGQENRLNTPWTGQESGLRYWNDKFLALGLRNNQFPWLDSPSGQDASNNIGAVLGEAVDLYTTVTTVVDQGTALVEQGVNTIANVVRERADQLSTFVTILMK
jgi:WXG100 family type VII secretion target